MLSIAMLLRHLHLGERGSGMPSRGEIQDFYKIREECLQSGKLWEDPLFPAGNKSLFLKTAPNVQYEWKRPTEMRNDAKFVVDGYSRFDINQGDLGDCWFLAAIACLTRFKHVFLRVVPDDQGFSYKYAGIFHFRFWCYGRWIDIVIDDRLPTFNGELIYIRSSSKNEFWSPLLEKAYAKLHGSYEALTAGLVSDALVDFTGGISEKITLKDAPRDFYEVLLKAYQRNSMLSASIDPNPEITEEELSNGLVKGHAYTISCVRPVPITLDDFTGEMPFIRMRNPWGSGEWKGFFGERTREWKLISEQEKKKIGLTFDVDGEFWILYNDFKNNFSRMDLCHFNPCSLSQVKLNSPNNKTWDTYTFIGEWVRGVTAGGCPPRATFCYNPQYRITLTEIDDNDQEKKCSVIFSLIRDVKRSTGNLGQSDEPTVLYVFKIENPETAPKPLDKRNLNDDTVVKMLGTMSRELSLRIKLSPGTYCIIPAIEIPNVEAQFILRVYAEKKTTVVENDDVIGEKPVDKKVVEKDEKENEKGKEFFKRIAGEDNEIDWMELKDLLDYTMKQELGRSEFSKEVCRSMIAMMDVDKSGKLGYEEFQILWKDLLNWKAVFNLYDKENANRLSAFALREALKSAGFTVNNNILNVLMHRYGTKEGYITFDDFIMCAVRVKVMIAYFRDKDPENTNIATFYLKDWLQKTLYS